MPAPDFSSTPMATLPAYPIGPAPQGSPDVDHPPHEPQSRAPLAVAHGNETHRNETQQLAPPPRRSVPTIFMAYLPLSSRVKRGRHCRGRSVRCSCNRHGPSSKRKRRDGTLDLWHKPQQSRRSKVDAVTAAPNRATSSATSMRNEPENGDSSFSTIGSRLPGAGTTALRREVYTR